MEPSLHVNGKSCSELVINTVHYVLKDGRGLRRFGLRFFTVSGPKRPTQPLLQPPPPLLAIPSNQSHAASVRLGGRIFVPLRNCSAQEKPYVHCKKECI